VFAIALFVDEELSRSVFNAGLVERIHVFLRNGKGGITPGDIVRFKLKPRSNGR
jgi:hypothetical protein